jgi:hypothetical protein
VNKNMEELITLDGKQFRLMSDRPLTTFERQQTISDIRRQSECSSCNRTQSLGNGIQTLASSCIDITVEAPADIAVTGIKVGSDTCPTGTCNPLMCSSTGCNSDNLARDVDVTYTNRGDQPGDIAPTLAISIGGIPIPPSPYTNIPLHILGGHSAIATFSVVLARGTNHICADFQLQ